MQCDCMVELDETVTQDEEGFVICPHHRVRRYGWLSGGGRDHSKDGWTDLQVERWVLYGEAPVLDTFTPRPAEQDRRDNRNPIDVASSPLMARQLHQVRGCYEPELVAEHEDEMSTAAIDARVRLDLRDKRDMPVHDARPLEVRDEGSYLLDPVRAAQIADETMFHEKNGAH